MSKAKLSLSWYSDLKAESDLSRMAVAYEVATIPFAKIDLVESRINGARLEHAIVHHKVEDYMQGYRNGDTFPRIVVYKTSSGYVILSGNQRATAIEKLIKEGDLPANVTIEVYLVQTQDKLLLESIARQANVAHGEGCPRAERIQQAIYCISALGMTTKDAAKGFLVSTQAISQNMRAEEVRRDLAKAGIDTSHVPTTALAPLAGLDDNERRNVGTLVAQHRPTAERVNQLTNQLKAQTSAPKRLQTVREFEKELAAIAHSKNGKTNGHAQSKIPQRPRRDKLISKVQSLCNFLESENNGEAFTKLEELQISTQFDRETAIKWLKKLHFRIGVLLK